MRAGHAEQCEVPSEAQWRRAIQVNKTVPSEQQSWSKFESKSCETRCFTLHCVQISTGCRTCNERFASHLGSDLVPCE